MKPTIYTKLEPSTNPWIQELLVLEDEPHEQAYDLTTALGKELAGINPKPIQVPPIKQDTIIDFIIASDAAEIKVDNWYTREAARIASIRKNNI